MGTLDIFLCFIFLVPECKGDDKSEILKQNKVFQAMFHNKDPDHGVDRVYTSDAYSMPPGRHLYHGKPALVLMYSNMARGTREVPLHEDSINVYGDVAVQCCHYKHEKKDRSVTERGKGCFVWRKDEYSKLWKAMAELWNKFQEQNTTG